MVCKIWELDKNFSVVNLVLEPLALSYYACLKLVYLSRKFSTKWGGKTPGFPRIFNLQKKVSFCLDHNKKKQYIYHKTCPNVQLFNAVQWQPGNWSCHRCWPMRGLTKIALGGDNIRHTTQNVEHRKLNIGAGIATTRLNWPGGRFCEKILKHFIKTLG